MSENVGAALDRAGRLFGDREAVVDGDLRWSYTELQGRVAAFDASLDDLGLQHGDVVGVLALNSAAHLVTWLAVPRSGRILNDLNVRLAPAELEFILSDSGAKVLIVDDAFLEVGKQLAEACACVEHLIHTTADFDRLSSGAGKVAATVDPDDIAGIFYTGGTTGLPKGAMLTHRNLVANAKHVLIALSYGDDEAYLHAAPMFHLANGASVFALTWVGGRHVIVPMFEPELWLKTVPAERVTRALLVPTMVNMVVNHPALADADLSGLRGMLYGASPMPEELLRAAMTAIPCDWYQGYGMTEASPLVTVLGPAVHREGGPRLRAAGQPIVGVEAEVRRDDGTPADVGEPGEIWVRGPNVMKGYWNRPEETEAALDDEGWYHSGDAAYVDDGGYLFIVDRVKDMIISGGENVYCTEVENAVYQHAAVLECAVFGVPDEQWGERVHAAIVLKPDTAATEEEIVEHCRPLIAGYKLPRSVDFHDEPLPKSGAGKLLKRELRKPYWEGRERQVS